MLCFTKDPWEVEQQSFQVICVAIFLKGYEGRQLFWRPLSKLWPTQQTPLTVLSPETIVSELLVTVDSLLPYLSVQLGLPYTRYWAIN